MYVIIGTSNEFTNKNDEKNEFALFKENE